MQTLSQILKIIESEGNSGEFYYKDIKCTWARDVQLGFLSGYIHIPKGHFNKTLTNSKGEEYFKYKRIERKDILKRFPIITYFQPCKNVQTNNCNVFGISFATIPSILPNVYDEQRKTLKEKFRRLKYMNLKQLTLILKNIIDYIVYTHTPQEQRYFVCTKCGRKQDMSKNYAGLCHHCHNLIKRGRYSNRRPKRGMLFTKRINKKKHIVCHVCGMYTQRLFAHASKKHNMTMEEYQEKYNISDEQIRKECYKDGYTINVTRRQQSRREQQEPRQ